MSLVENIYQFRKNVKCIWLEIFRKINIKKKDLKFIKKKQNKYLFSVT